MSIEIRPLQPGHVAAAHQLSYDTFAELDARAGEPVPELTDARRLWGERRVAHLLSTDPGGAWVAENQGRLVGVALASRRARLWFLSLLVVEPGLQGQGTGRRLLDAALQTLRDDDVGLICSSDDPKALRRYRAAGFALLPCYRGKGRLDRARLPAVDGVREGSWDDDRAFVDAVAVQVRGAPLGPDADLHRIDSRLLVADGPAGRGFAVASHGAVRPVAATTPAAARALLVSALAGLDDAEPVSVEFVDARQQWAVEVMRELALPFAPAESLAVRGFSPAGPYLPSGAFG